MQYHKSKLRHSKNEKHRFETIVRWDEIKQNTPSKLKFPPLKMIPHKSRNYREILDLSFVLKFSGCDLPSVNEATKEKSTAEAIDQVGTVMPRIIETLAKALLS